MEYETLDSYMRIAKKTISKFAAKMYPSLVKEMLNNDETVSEIAEAIMIADWKWDGERKGKKTGMGKNLYSYRNQCAIWAIKTYVTQKYRRSNKEKAQQDYIKSVSFSRDDDPYKIISEKELQNNIKIDINRIIEIVPLSEKQRDQLKLYYYEDKTLSDIGKIYNVTREAVRQNINKSLTIIKKYVNTN
jgi:RNA polymerase sigma factor (sigma-70 family)